MKVTIANPILRYRLQVYDGGRPHCEVVALRPTQEERRVDGAEKARVHQHESG